MLCEKYTNFVHSIHNLRDIAWMKAMKYQHDPVVGKTHELYLDALNTIISAQKTQQEL